MTGHITNMTTTGDIFALLDGDIFDPTKIHKIPNGAKMNIGRVIPLVGQGFGDWHAAFEQKLGSKFPVCKIGKAHQGFVRLVVSGATWRIGTREGR